MTRMALTAATRLLRDNLNLRLVEQRGEFTDWACDVSLQRFTFTHAQLATMIANCEAEFLLAGKEMPAEIPPDPENVDAADRALAERNLEYVLDMHRSGLAHRPKLTDFERQILETSKRLHDDTPPEAWTVKRWLKRCGDEPCWWRLLPRTARKGNRGLRVTDEQLAIINRQIDERYMRRPPISVANLLPHIRNAVRLANLERAADDHIDNVGRDAVLSVIALRDPEAVHAARHGALAARDKYRRVRLQGGPEAPLDRIEIDHTRADLYVVSDEDGLPIGRPYIGFALDRCTRMPFGIYMGFEPESVLSVMQILKNGIFPKTYVREKIGSGEWDLKHDWPVWGMPRGIVFDRGMAGLSHDLRRAALEIGIRDVTFVSAKTGAQKGAIERFFKTQNQKLLHQQRGTTFSNVVKRGDYDSKKNAIIPYSDMLRMAHRFLVDIYPHEQHEGLGKRLPVRVWNELIDKYPSDPVKPMEHMVHLFTRSKTVTLRREGVRLKSIFYNSDELDTERKSADFASACPTRNVLLRYDPADLGYVWIRLPHRRDRYIRVPADGHWFDYAAGRSVWEHDQIRAHHVATVGGEFDADGAAESRASLIDDMDKADRRRKRASTATRRARMDGTGRTSPAGSDHSTTPAASTAGRRAAAKKAPAAANDGGGKASKTNPDTPRELMAPRPVPTRGRVMSMGPSKRSDK